MKSWILMALVALLSAPSLAADDPLEAVAFLVGEWRGEGKHPYGIYRETQSVTRALNGTVLEVRTKSVMGERTVHEDLRVISWDAEKKKLRMRQWAKGVLRIYTARSESGGRVVFEETAREGASPDRWRYTFTPNKPAGFSYRVEVDDGKGWKPFVSGDLGAELKDPGKGGGLGVRQYDTTIGGMRAQIHHPDGKGPYPVIVFSPGGSANSTQGYRPYGRWWATWGYITVIVAFNDESAIARAPKFKTVLDWVVKENERKDAPLHGMVDPKRLALAGHSRGGNAALRAARIDERVRACLALAPSGPEEPVEGKATGSSCLIIGDRDKFLGAATKAYENAAGERFLLEIAGMSHMLEPREATLKLVKRATAFLNYALKGDSRYRVPLETEAEGVKVKQSGR